MKRILLVDDAETILTLERMVLGDHYDIVTACNGAEAVERARSERPDLVLMDLMMPQMSGLDACRAMQRESTTRGIPIIMVTTRSEQELVQEALLAGCLDYVTKPIDSVELLAKVRNILGD